MQLTYAEDVWRINMELDEEVNEPKQRKPTFLERQLAHPVPPHDKGNFEEVEQIERSITWKQSVKSAAHRHVK